MMKAKYTGAGGYIPGIPAHDLSADEYEEHEAAILAHLENASLPLYELPASADAPTLASLKGVGKATLETLAGAGIHTLHDLLALEATEIVMHAPGLGEQRVTEWQKEARDRLQKDGD